MLLCLEALVLHIGTSLVKAQGTSCFRFFSKLQRFVSLNVCFSSYTHSLLIVYHVDTAHFISFAILDFQ